MRPRHLNGCRSRREVRRRFMGRRRWRQSGLGLVGVGGGRRRSRLLRQADGGQDHRRQHHSGAAQHRLAHAAPAVFDPSSTGCRPRTTGSLDPFMATRTSVPLHSTTCKNAPGPSRVLATNRADRPLRGATFHKRATDDATTTWPGPRLEAVHQAHAARPISSSNNAAPAVGNGASSSRRNGIASAKPERAADEAACPESGSLTAAMHTGAR